MRLRGPQLSSIRPCCNTYTAWTGSPRRKTNALVGNVNRSHSGWLAINSSGVAFVLRDWACDAGHLINNPIWRTACESNVVQDTSHCLNHRDTPRSSQSTIKFQLSVQIIQGGAAEAGKLRSAWCPVMADDQVRHLGVNLQASQSTPTSIHRTTATAVLTGAATVPAEQD